MIRWFCGKKVTFSVRRKPSDSDHMTHCVLPNVSKERKGLTSHPTLLMKQDRPGHVHHEVHTSCSQP